MKITKPIDFQHVGELSQQLRSERASKERFSLEIPERDCANGLYAAMKAEVERRGGMFVADSDFKSYILTAARWLVNPDSTPGLLLCGLYGNGKTTMAMGIASLIKFITEREDYTNRKSMPMHTAKEICRMCATSEGGKGESNGRSAYEKLFREQMLIIDDLGEEPREVMVYGMIHTPIIDLISERYAKQLMTIVTTNLNVDQIGEKYGGRIYDRFKEMLTSIVFENESYRTQKKNNLID